MGLGHSPKIVTDGLVLCLDAANQKSYPGSGTSWTDLSGNSNHGTLINGPAFSASKFSLDSVDDYIEITSFTNVDFVSNFTIECIFNQKGALTPGPLVEKYNWAQVNKGGWGLRFNGGNLLFFINDNTTGSSVSTTGLSSGTNYYCVAVCENGPTTPVLKLYVNGQLMNTVSATTNITTTVGKPVYVGQRGDTSGAYNWVDIFAVKMYTRALTANEVKQNFQALRGRFGI